MIEFINRVLQISWFKHWLLEENININAFSSIEKSKTTYYLEILNLKFNTIRSGQVDDVLEHFCRNPRTSTRAAVSSMEILDHIAEWIALNRDNYHPYHFKRVQGLFPTDYAP